MSDKKIIKSNSEWKDLLTPEEYHVTREKGTEKPFTGQFWDSKKEGAYQCTCCGSDLFLSNTKFDSGTGWPSFYAPIDKSNIECISDDNYGMTRTEVICSTCGAHLGHVFTDGPKPTGLRYCINSASLKLKSI